MPGRKSVLVSDVVESEKQNDLYWFAHTKADIELTASGALLSQNGKQLRVTIERPAGVAFEVVNASGFPTSPDPGEQSDNTTMKKLMIRQSVKSVEIQVQFEPTGG